MFDAKLNEFTRCINELSSYHFQIPSYQRGYRWTELQVRQFLDDLKMFCDKSNDSDWYCLQPLVVQHLDNDKWLVVDGQQRLTTLYIVLSVLGRRKHSTFSFEFDKDVNREEARKFGEYLAKDLRPNSPDWDFIEQHSGDSADHYCVRRAVETARNWLSEQEWTDMSTGKEKFASDISVRVRFIWYEADSDDKTGYEVFERLNSGKIPLSNAELVKALLLCNAKHGDKQKASIVAREWDEIEQQLHDDEFWYFINPDADDLRFSATRMEFFFEIILRTEIQMHKEGGGLPKWLKRGLLYDSSGHELAYLHQEKMVDGSRMDELDYDRKCEENPYFVFYVFWQYVKGEKDGLEDVWNVVKLIYKTIQRWFKDRTMYHLIGFLMNQRGYNLFERLIDFIQKSQTSSHSFFVDTILLGSVRDVFGFDENETKVNDENSKFREYLSGLSYESAEGKRGIYNVLLLFNVILMVRQSSELSRYPFSAHSMIKTGWRAGWSLEHIHAKQEAIDASDLKSYARYFQEAEGNPSLDLLNRHLDRHGLRIDSETLGDASKLHLVVTESGKASQDWRVTHGLCNMALLDCSRNAEFNNGSYLVKRRLLDDWERGDRESKRALLGDFVPPGTKMAFYKHFSRNVEDDFPLAWTGYDRECYFEAIANTITVFLTPEQQGR